ncbi:hypothetical protein PV797_10820 [Clostridiaceae bacterium M8S5]|nr:hypothetical protein PV797_10820 [Clostridiaceae bacterium M8S5]
MKILIVDVGYGGLLISSLIYEKIKQEFFNDKYSIMFCALKDESFSSKDDIQSSYNEKLEELIQKFDPSILVLACNSLSVNYNVIKKNIHVVNISKINANYMLKTPTNEYTAVVYFGSNTTTGSKYYENILMTSGFNIDNIYGIACEGLANAIELGNRQSIRYAVYSYVKLLSQSLTKQYHRTYIYLCCTHYGYVMNIFSDAFKYFKIPNYKVIQSDQNSANEITKTFNKSYCNNKYKPEFNISNLERLSTQRKKTLHSYIKPFSKDIATILKTSLPSNI